MKNTKLLAALLGLVAVGAIATGCSLGEAFETATSGATRDDEAPTVETEAPEPEPAVEEEPEPEPEPEFEVFTFGDGLVYEDGLELAVSLPEVFTPSEWAAGADGAGTGMRMTITIMNGTSEPYEPFSAMASASSGGTEASEIYDTEAGLSGEPSSTILPGDTLSWDVGYMMADVGDVTLTINPDSWVYEDMYFKSPGT